MSQDRSKSIARFIAACESGLVTEGQISGIRKTLNWHATAAQTDAILEAVQKHGGPKVTPGQMEKGRAALLRALFNVTYEIVTHESAELGDADERGFISQSVGLREAVKDFRQTRTSMCDGITDLYANASSGRPHWITVNNGMEFHTGAYESRSLHIPCTVSDSSAKRIARLLGA